MVQKVLPKGPRVLPPKCEFQKMRSGGVPSISKEVLATGNKSNEVVRLNGNVVKEILEESGVEQDILAAKMTLP